jgi:hypothetical protein
MIRRIALLMLIALPLAVQAADSPSFGSLTSALKDPLTSMLSSQLGVTADQAKGGVGSYLTLAKEKLAKGDFDKVAAVVPGASKYMESAKQLGAVSGPLKSVAGLNGALGKLGIAPETAAKFVPAITDYLGKAGGSNLTKILSSVMH